MCSSMIFDRYNRDTPANKSFYSNKWNKMWQLHAITFIHNRSAAAATTTKAATTKNYIIAHIQIHWLRRQPFLQIAIYMNTLFVVSFELFFFSVHFHFILDLFSWFLFSWNSKGTPFDLNFIITPSISLFIQTRWKSENTSQKEENKSDTTPHTLDYNFYLAY